MRPKRTLREKGFVWFWTAMSMVVIIPMMGLAVDASMLFLVRAKIQGAVDGAALAGARALARGSSSALQTAAAQAAATAYVKLNYPTGYLLTTNLTITAPTVDTTVTNQRTITVTANVTSPSLFMRYVGVSGTTLGATAQTIRRDVNVVIVLDRSGSLTASNSCTPLKAAAQNFVNKFADGRDNLGLVTFAASTAVNFPIANNFKTASTNISTMISSITCAGSTSSAMALWQGYEQLISLNQPGALNIILFFTDGKPTGVAFKMPVANASPCTAYTAYSPASSAPAGAKGWIQGLYNTYTNQDQFFGLLDETGHFSRGVQVITNGDNLNAPNTTNCTCTSNQNDTSDFVGVPKKDIFGSSTVANSHTGTLYQAITLNGAGLIDLGNVSNASAMAINAADDAATRIRYGAVDSAGKSLQNIIIYSIGLGNAAYPLSPGLLQRISNDPASGSFYDASKPQGLYVAAPTSGDIDSAFSVIASEVLRLAK